LLRVEDLAVSYGNVAAVRGLSFTVEPGEVVALVGANGAGKTSTLNALTGIVRRSGRITFAGEEIGSLATDDIVRRGIVQVPQGRQLFPEMSVRDNVELGAFLRPAAAKRAGIEAMMRRFPLLKERAQQAAGTLSGGEQQVVAIARALMAAPRLLLLDEPCLGLSPIMVERMQEIIRALNEEGLSILLVEQNAAFAFGLAMRILVIENGRLALSGTPAELSRSDEVRRSYLGI
jgi:branched-chain amino acid transport system ATP-binding protein